MLGSDLMKFNGNSYMVDYYFDFFEVDQLTNKTAEEIIYKLKAHLAGQGIRDRMITDNGPPEWSQMAHLTCSQKFHEFAETWDFEHVTSSPYYPQLNGKAENAVKQKH